MILPRRLALVAFLVASDPARALGQVPIGPGPPPDPVTAEWAIRAALLHHPAVRAARSGVESAVATSRSARSAWWPQLALDGRLTRFQFPMLVRPLHELDASQIEFDPALVQGNLVLDFALLDGGVRGSAIRRADAARDGSVAGLAAAEMDLIERTVAAFLNVETLRRILAAGEARLTAFEEERARAQLFVDAGRAPELELLRAEASESRAQADLATTRAMVLAAEARLARLVGVESAVVGEWALASLRVLGPAPEPTPTTARAHPVLSEAWSRVARAEAERSATTAQWIPRVGLSAGMRQYGTADLDFTNEWQVGLFVSYPLFTGFRRRHEAERTDALVDAARERYRLQRLELDQELDEARAAETESDARVAALERAVAQSAEVARIEALALEAGAGVQRDFLEAQATLFHARASLAEARHAGVLARVRVAGALGVLDADWIRNNLESVP